MSDLLYNDDAVDTLTKAKLVSVGHRYEAAIVVAVQTRLSPAADVLLRLNVRPARFYSFTQLIETPEGIPTDNDTRLAEIALGCTEQQIRDGAKAQATRLANNYIGSEHLLLAAVSSSSYLSDVFDSQFGIDINLLTEGIIERQSEARIVIDRQFDYPRRMFRSIAFASERREFEVLSRAMDRYVKSCPAELKSIVATLQQWIETRVSDPSNDSSTRTSIVEEYPWISY